MKTLWHFECNDGTHYVEWNDGKRDHMKRMTKEEYEAFTGNNPVEQMEENLDFLQ